MYIRGFDGLRALAMILVFFTHKTQWGADTQIGFAGVWIFFLLSGFLITGQLRASRSAVEKGETTAGQETMLFLLKRSFRILPAYYVLLLLVTPFYIATNRDVSGLPWYLAYLSNIYFQFHPSEFLTTWAHFWTLAVEEQFYVLFAPLLLLVPSRYATQACLIVIGASLVQRFSLAVADVEPYVIYIDSLVNFGLLATGGLLAIHRETLSRVVLRAGLDRSAVGVTALLAIVALSPLARSASGSNLILLQALYLLAALTAIVLIMNVYCGQQSRFVQILEWRPIAAFGRISYGLYLYNDYVKADIPERMLRSVARVWWTGGTTPEWVAFLLKQGGTGADLMDVLGLLACFGILLTVARVSWMAVEMPALKLRRRFLAKVGNAHRRNEPSPAPNRELQPIIVPRLVA